MIPTTPWEAMWKGTAEWFGILEGDEMNKVLPMHQTFLLNHCVVNRICSMQMKLLVAQVGRVCSRDTVLDQDIDKTI